MQQTPLSILQQYWGHKAFRPLQENIINSVLEKDDVLALLPTGGGKSVCYQVPAMLKEGICLVISPLIALIKDQVEALQKKGIGALSIYSGMHYNEVKRTLQNAAFGDYKFLYVSPERLQTDLFLEFLPAIKPSLIVVDEAHCISQWGYDFRPAYLRIAELRAELPGVNVIAVTASATPEVQLDICEKLNFVKGFKSFRQSFVRPNISYSAFSPASRQVKLLDILRKVKGCSIVYCGSRKATQEIAALLIQNKISAAYYHAGLEVGVRDTVQGQWLNNTTQCIVCTNAFGMGIDKPDVRVVVHYDIPESLENYYQEAGRAGRDGNRSYAVLLFEKIHILALQDKSALKYPSFDYIKSVYNGLMNHLQIAAGGGENVAFDFDLALFARNFKFNILQCTYAIKALGEEGLVAYNELLFKPSTIQFTCSKADLDHYYESRPDLEPVLKGLLRSYEGIFDYPSTIYESLLAAFIPMKMPELLQKLAELHSLHLVDYKTGGSRQQVVLLRNRMYADSFTLNIKSLHRRKSFYETRIKSMVAYAEDIQQCRNSFIAFYFGDATTKPCGICDNCLRKKYLSNKQELVKQTCADILQKLKVGEQSITTLLLLRPSQQEEIIWEAIKFLEQELKIGKKTGDTLSFFILKN